MRRALTCMRVAPVNGRFAGARFDRFARPGTGSPQRRAGPSPFRSHAMHRNASIRTVVVGLVAAVVSLTVLAGPASAAPATDLVRLTAINADFGDNTWVNNAPTG